MIDDEYTYFIENLKKFNNSQEQDKEYYEVMERYGNLWHIVKCYDSISTNDLVTFKILNVYNTYFLKDLYDTNILKYIIYKGRLEFMVELVENDFRYVEEFYNLLIQRNLDRKDVIKAFECLFYDERIRDISQDSDFYNSYINIFQDYKIYKYKLHINSTQQDVYKLIIDAFIEKIITVADFITGIELTTAKEYKVVLYGEEDISELPQKYQDIFCELEKHKNELTNLIYATYYKRAIERADFVEYIQEYVKCINTLLDIKTKAQL